MKVFLKVIFVWMILTSCTKDQPAPVAHIWTAFTYSQIGSARGIWSMTVDTSRNIWVTPAFQENNGVIKFDKVNWSIIRPSSQINFSNISCDSRNRIWTTNNPVPNSREKVFMFNGQGWQSYRIPDDLPDGYVTTIDIDIHDNIYLPFGNYFLKFDGVSWTKFLLPVRSLSGGVTFDYDNNITWFGTDQGLVKIMGDSTVWIREVIINKDTIGLGFSKPLFNKKTKELYVSTSSGLFRYNGTSWTQFTKANSAIPCSDVMSMALDKRGDLWVGTYCGIAKFSNDKFTTYTSPFSNGSGDRTHKIILDNKGSLWFYVYNLGIAKLDNY